jgi:DNA polymerase epsilon subunit 1
MYKKKQDFQKNGGGGGQKKSHTDWGANFSGKGGKDGGDRYERKIRLDDDVALEKKFSIDILGSGDPRIGYLFNMKQSAIQCDDENTHISALLLYFVQLDGSSFRASLAFRPYLLVDVLPQFGVSNLDSLADLLGRKYESSGVVTELVQKDDLEMPDHLTGRKHTFIRLNFPNTESINEVKRSLQEIVKGNNTRLRGSTLIQDADEFDDQPRAPAGGTDPLDYISGLFEHDVSLINRASIDLEVRCGHWYKVNRRSALDLTLELMPDFKQKPLLRVFAFDIETTKAPLKFPDSKFD